MVHSRHSEMWTEFPLFQLIHLTTFKKDITDHVISYSYLLPCGAYDKKSLKNQWITIYYS